MRALAGLLLALVCAPSPPAAAGQTAPPPQATLKAPQRDLLGYFVGRWQVASRDPATGETLAVEYVVTPAPGGAWLAGSGASADGAFASRDMWGVDPLSGELIRVIFDGAGTFATVRARGWTGERLMLEGEARSAGGVVRVRETITRLTSDRFDAVWEAYRDGKWVAYAVETVTRRR